VDDAVGWVGEIHRAGGVTTEHAERLRRHVVEERPREATWGLCHGDFGAENLVAGAHGLVCVDNPTVRPDVLEVDLGFVWNRWRMGPAERERFLVGYRSGGDPGRFLRGERFWCVTAALRSVVWRVREGAGDIGLPLGELCAHVP
jgi:thiamine kinase-like enzyme